MLQLQEQYKVSQHHKKKIRYHIYVKHVTTLHGTSLTQWPHWAGGGGPRGYEKTICTAATASSPACRLALDTEI